MRISAGTRSDNSISSVGAIQQRAHDLSLDVTYNITVQ